LRESLKGFEPAAVTQAAAFDDDGAGSMGDPEGHGGATFSE